MLVQMLPEQVNAKWDIIAPLIAKSLPPGWRASRYALTSILRALLMENAKCWAYIHEDVWYGIVVTTVYIDPLTLQRNLLVYAVASVRPATASMWEEALSVLKAEAEVQNCNAIVAYTNVRSISRLIESAGGKAEYTFLELEV